MYKSCNILECKKRGYESYQGYCPECYIIYLLQHLNTSHINTNTNTNNSIDFNSSIQDTTKFIPQVEVSSDISSNVSSTSSTVSDDNINTSDIVNKLKEI